jgi:hypothetical protein
MGFLEIKLRRTAVQSRSLHQGENNFARSQKNKRLSQKSFIVIAREERPKQSVNDHRMKFF